MPGHNPSSLFIFLAPWQGEWYPQFLGEGSEAQGLGFPRVTEPVCSEAHSDPPPPGARNLTFPEPHLPQLVAYECVQMSVSE